MLDATLGYILCCQSPTLFLAAALLLICYFARRRAHHARAILDLVLCILCAAAGVALYFLGMGRGYFSIRDFYEIRTPAWIGMAAAAAIAVWLVIRAFLAANRRRRAEKEANRAANAEAHQREEEAKAAAKQQAELEKAANAAAVAHISESVDQVLTEGSDTASDPGPAFPPPMSDPPLPDPAQPIELTLEEK